MKQKTPMGKLKYNLDILKEILRPFYSIHRLHNNSKENIKRGDCDCSIIFTQKSNPKKGFMFKFYYQYLNEESQYIEVLEKDSEPYVLINSFLYDEFKTFLNSIVKFENPDVPKLAKSFKSEKYQNLKLSSKNSLEQLHLEFTEFLRTKTNKAVILEKYKKRNKDSAKIFKEIEESEEYKNVVRLRDELRQAQDKLDNLKMSLIKEIDKESNECVDLYIAYRQFVKKELKEQNFKFFEKFDRFNVNEREDVINKCSKEALEDIDKCNEEFRNNYYIHSI